MSIDLGALKSAIVKQKKRVNDTTLELMQKVAIQVDQALVLATPRLTGRAANNWLPTLNIPSTQVSNTVGSPSQALALAVPVISSSKLGDTIYFTNNLPYIGRLNDGYSKKAPAGFVEKAAIAAQASLGG